MAAAASCRASLEVSYNPNANPLEINALWHEALSFFSFKPETEEEFIARMGLKTFSLVRLANKPSDAIYEAAAEMGCFLNTDPVLATGRLELLHYFHEISLSIDYHRYGNLGTREGEERAPIK